MEKCYHWQVQGGTKNWNKELIYVKVSEALGYLNFLFKFGKKLGMSIRQQRLNYNLRKMLMNKV